MKKSVRLMLVVTIIVSLIIGFLGGMEYKAYQVRSALKQAFSQSSTSPIIPDQAQSATPSTQSFIDDSIGQSIVLQTLSLKVVSSKEQNYIESQYSSPVSADPGSKFVVVTLSVTNLTNGDFTLPSDAFSLLDNQGRLFKPYQNTIGNIDNYLADAELSPSIPKQGVFVYEMPTTATSYSFVTAKAGTNDLYRVKLQ